MSPRVRATTIFLAVALAAGCADPLGPPRVEPPTAPTADDARYTVDGPGWYLVGDAATAAQDTMVIEVVAPAGVDAVDVWVAGRPGVRLTAEDGHRFTGSFAIGDLPVGSYDVLLAADGATTGFARRELHRSHPLYFVMSTDWDFAEPGQNSLDIHDRLRADHPGLRYTHFVGPYTFTDPELTEARKAELATWLTTRRDQHDDEIGLHIHPWCHFVATSGLPCITDQSTVYPEGDPTGYTVKVAAYGEADFGVLLEAADEVFAARGLGKPVTFRAGGWTASVETLRALHANGFVADTSANNWMRMEEWNANGGSELYTWNMANWSMIGDTSQPYYPNIDDAQSPAAPQIGILEVPDNAIMVDYVTAAEMIAIFGANWDGAPLPAPRSFMMGFHPSPRFGGFYFSRLQDILGHADQFLATNHDGPVVYAVLRELAEVWTAP